MLSYPVTLDEQEFDEVLGWLRRSEAVFNHANAQGSLPDDRRRSHVIRKRLRGKLERGKPE